MSHIAVVIALGAMLIAVPRGQAQVASSDPPDGPRFTLVQVLQDALGRHPVISGGQARVEAARAERRTAGRWTNPMVQYQVENLEWPGRSVTGLERETSVMATLPLEPLLQRWPRVRGADAFVRVAQAEAASSRRQVALDVMHAFYAAASAQVVVDASRDVRQWLDSLVTYTGARVREGAAAEGDLLKLEVERDRAAADEALAEVERARAAAQLRANLQAAAPNGVQPAAVVAAPDSTFTVTVPASFTMRLDIARRQRPEARAARERLAALRSAVTLERARVIPDFGAMIGTKRMSGVASLMAGFSAPLPIFNQNRGEWQRANAELRAAEFDSAWTDRLITAEVTSASVAATAIGRRLQILRPGFLERATESRRIALGAYREGASSLLEVLDAARTLADARIAYYRALFAQQQSVLELNAALGAEDITAFPTTSADAGTEP